MAILLFSSPIGAMWREENPANETIQSAILGFSTGFALGTYNVFNGTGIDEDGTTQVIAASALLIAPTLFPQRRALNAYVFGGGELVGYLSALALYFTSQTPPRSEGFNYKLPKN